MQKKKKLTGGRTKSKENPTGWGVDGRKVRGRMQGGSQDNKREPDP